MDNREVCFVEILRGPPGAADRWFVLRDEEMGETDG